MKWDGIVQRKKITMKSQQKPQPIPWGHSGTGNTIPISSNFDKGKPGLYTPG